MQDGSWGGPGRPKGLMGAAAPRPGPENLRTLYYVAAAMLAALVPLILFAGLWLRAELKESERELETYLLSRSDALSERLDAEINREISVLAGHGHPAEPRRERPRLFPRRGAADRGLHAAMGPMSPSSTRRPAARS